MIIHDEKKTYHGLMTIFVKQCYETLIDCAHANGGKLEYRTNFILDEFANMPPLKDVDAMVTAARSRDIRFTFIIQNFAQLNEVYGEEIAQVVKGNCGNLVYLISTELKALEEISKMCGEVKSKEKDKTASTPLVTVSDLQKLKLFEAIIIRWRKNPFKTKLTPDFKINWGVKYGKATLRHRGTKRIELFDIKKFVSDKKKDEELNNPKPFGASNPFMGGGFNPFLQGSTPMPNNIPNTIHNNDQNNRPYANISDKEIDDMVKDIEKKLAALDEEEKKSKDKDDSKVNDQDNTALISDDFEEDKELIKPVKKNESDSSPSFEEVLNKIEENKKKVPKDELQDNDKPKEDDMSLTQEIKIDDVEKAFINVDKDSVVVNENVITDDEYYDDFFE